jgi:hypothetical protein
MTETTLTQLNINLMSIAAQSKELGIKIAYDLVVGIWPQTWGDTSCGFGGFAGQAITSAFTVVIENDNGYHVFIDGRYAYTVKRPNEMFWQAVASRKLIGGKSGVIYERIENNTKGIKNDRSQGTSVQEK